MMDEMQKTLARRRAKVDRSSEEPDSGEAADQSKEKGGSPGKPYPVSGGGSQAGSESPKPGTVSQLLCQHSHTVHSGPNQGFLSNGYNIKYILIHWHGNLFDSLPSFYSPGSRSLFLLDIFFCAKKYF